MPHTITDADRYRWLRAAWLQGTESDAPSEMQRAIGYAETTAEMDAAIDAELQKPESAHLLSARAGDGETLKAPVVASTLNARDEAIRFWHLHCDPFKSWLGTIPPSPVIDAMLNFAGQARHKLLNTPELHSFSEGVTLEALHQRERWGADHDAGKAPADWFWLVGYLAGKALHAQTSGNNEKALHHTISTAAALANWHAAITGAHTAMRPGIDPVARGFQAPATVSGSHA